MVTFLDGPGQEGAHDYVVYGTDIVDRGWYATNYYDFLNGLDRNGIRISKWNGDIITNPPYKYAQKFVENAMDVLADGHKLAMFLKLTFLEGNARKRLFEKYPPKCIYVYSRRAMCAKNGEFEKYPSSAVAYAWYVWEKGFTGDPKIKWIQKFEIRKENELCAHKTHEFSPSIETWNKQIYSAIYTRITR